jgi:hypothetical protein
MTVAKVYVDHQLNFYQGADTMYTFGLYSAVSGVC